MSDTTRLRALTEAGLLHPNPDAVLAPLFTGGSGFFLASDKVQVKYEMLRAHLVDGLHVSEAAAAHGYSRAAFYLVTAAFDQSGMAGLVDERRGRRGPVKLRPEIVDFIRPIERKKLDNIFQRFVVVPRAHHWRVTFDRAIADIHLIKDIVDSLAIWTPHTDDNKASVQKALPHPGQKVHGHCHGIRGYEHHQWPWREGQLLQCCEIRYKL